MKKIWYIKGKNKVFGPFSVIQMGAFLKQGKIKNSTQISLDEQHWLALEESNLLIQIKAEEKKKAQETQQTTGTESTEVVLIQETDNAVQNKDKIDVQECEKSSGWKDWAKFLFILVGVSILIKVGFEYTDRSPLDLGQNGTPVEKLEKASKGKAVLLLYLRGGKEFPVDLHYRKYGKYSIYPDKPDIYCSIRREEIEVINSEISAEGYQDIYTGTYKIKAYLTRLSKDPLTPDQETNIRCLSGTFSYRAKQPSSLSPTADKEMQTLEINFELVSYYDQIIALPGRHEKAAFRELKAGLETQTFTLRNSCLAYNCLGNRY